MIDFPKFLTDSYIANSVRLDTRVVVHKTRLSVNDLLMIKKKGAFEAPREKKELCELEIGGEVVAAGKIVKIKDEYFFKVMK